MKTTLFATNWFMIGVVAAIDAALVVHFAAGLNELNPVARLIFVQGGAAALVAVKFFGTAVVFGVLAALYKYRQNIALITSSAVAAFQCGLLAFLFLA